MVISGGFVQIFLDAGGRLYYEINAGDRDAYMVNIDAQTGRARSQPLPLSKEPGADYFGPQFSTDGKYVAMTTRPGNQSAAVLIRSLSGDESADSPSPRLPAVPSGSRACRRSR